MTRNSGKEPLNIFLEFLKMKNFKNLFFLRVRTFFEKTGILVVIFCKGKPFIAIYVLFYNYNF